MSNQLELMKQFQALLPAAARAKAAQGNLNKDLSEGITAGFGIISLRGKVWRRKYQGEEVVMMEDDGRRPRYSIDVVIVKASPNISKVWYEHGYTEGSNAPPDCWSVDGKVPDRASPKLQNATCAGCKWNAWGSSRSAGGSGKGKDCADSKRIAVVPSDDMQNERYGGPMLLRIPPASLGDVLDYAKALALYGATYDAVVTELSFDPSAEYPKLHFRPIRPLTEDEYAKVEELQKLPVTERILNTAVDHVQTDGIDTSHTATGAAPNPAGNVTPIRPQQAPQAAPAGFQPQPAPAQAQPAQPAPAAPQPPHDADGVIMEEEPNEQREALRKMGTLTEEQINAALGPPKMRPVQKPASPLDGRENDPQVIALRAAKLTDEQIMAVMGLRGPQQTFQGMAATPAAPLTVAAPPPPMQPQPETQHAQPATPQGEPAKRKRRTKAEMEADAKAAAAAAGANGAAPPATATAQQENPATPPDFEAMLAGMLGQQPK
jgi:hypothetical protein